MDYFQEPTTPELEVASSSQLLPRQQQQGRKRRSSNSAAAIEEGNQQSETIPVATVEEESRPTRSLFLARVRSHGVENTVLDDDTRAQRSNTDMTEFCNSDDDHHFNALTDVQCSPFDQSQQLLDDDSRRFPLSQSAGINLKDIISDCLTASPDCEEDCEDDILSSVSACKFDLQGSSRQPPHADGSYDFDMLGSSPFLNTSFQSQPGSQMDESTAHFSTPVNTPNSPFDELIDVSFTSEDMNTCIAKEPSAQVKTIIQSSNSFNEDTSPFLSLAGDQLFLVIY